MSYRLPPWNQESLKKNIFYVTTYDQYSNYIWVTIVAHIPWISQPFFVSLRACVRHKPAGVRTKGGSLSCTRRARAQATLALL